MNLIKWIKKLFCPSLYRVKWLYNFGSCTIIEKSWDVLAYSKRDAHKKFIQHLGKRPWNQYTDDSVLASYMCMKEDISKVACDD